MNRCFSHRPSAADAGAHELWIYGDIGESWSGESVQARDFVRDIAAIQTSHLVVRINSYGGSVSDGLAIYNALKRHPAQVTVTIDGVAASVASLIAMAGDVVEMAENALMMVHAPWAGAQGNARDLREFADMLDKYAEAMVSSYASKTGRRPAELLALLTDGEDHWYSADEAKAAGFVDAVTPAVPVAAALDHKRFKVPARLAGRFSKESTVTTTPNAPAAEAPEDIRAQVLAADRVRREDIARSFRGFAEREGVSALMAACQNDSNCSPDQARQRLIAHLTRDEPEPIGGHYCVTVDDVYAGRSPLDAGMGNSTPRALMAEALAYRAGGPAPSQGNPFLHARIPEMGRQILAARGMSPRDLSDSQVVSRLINHTTSDFADLLESTAYRVLRESYRAAPSGIRRIARKSTARDFRPKAAVMLDGWPALEKVHEGAEFTHGSPATSKESYRIETFGRMFAITRQALVNDDLGAFGGMTKAFARSATELEARTLAALVTSNPVMSDTKALFHTDHGNLAGTGAVLSVASLGAARAAMRLQKGLDGVTPIDAAPRYLLVPAALETLAESVVAQIYATKVDDANPFSGRLEVVVDPRLDAVSTKAWYLFADSSALDTIEYSYLENDEGPAVTVKDGFDIDGVTVKVRLDFGCGALDWRGAYRNDGPAPEGG